MSEIFLEGILLAGRLLLKTLPFIILGVIFAEFIIALRLMDKVSFLARPITNFAHLRRECGASFLTAFVSPSAANAMLAGYFNRGLISKRELFIASMINSFPSIVMEWRFMFPVLLPLLGLTGLIYFLILTIIGFLKTGLLMLVGRMILKKGEDWEIPLEAQARPPLKEALSRSIRASKDTIRRIIFWTVPSMVISCILIKAGVFDILASYLKGAASWFPIPAGGLGIIAARFGHHIAAYTVASSLMSAGELTSKGVILSLLVGNILTTLTSPVRHLLPYYVGIFGPRMGAELMLLSSAIRNGIAIILVFGIALVPGF